MTTAALPLGAWPSAEPPDRGRRWRLLGWVVRAVVVLNLLDAVLTLLWVNTGIAVEANALLSDLVETNALAFMVVKLSLVSLGLLLLWRQRERKLAVAGLMIAFVAYNSLLVYHLGIAAIAVERALV